MIYILLTTICLLSLSASCANEFWITSDNSTGSVVAPISSFANAGSQLNPFDGSTPQKFDLMINNLPPASLIHLGVGTFQTMGNTTWGPHNGQHIVGAGIGLTILQFPSNAVVSGVLNLAHLIQPISPCTNVTVSDLTLDCNYQLGCTGTLNGITLCGSDNRIERVRCINTAAISTSITNYQEAWGIQISPFPYADGRGNLIRDCEVSHFHGTGINDLQAIGLSSGSGRVLDSDVIGDTNGFVYGLNCGSHDVIIEGNILTHVVNGIHYDSGIGLTNALIKNNLFIGCNEAADFANSILQNVSFEGNIIQLENVANSSSIQAFYFQADVPDNSPAGYHNIDIGENMVSLAPSLAKTTGPMGRNRFIWGNNMQGLVFHDNMFSASFFNTFGLGNTGINGYNNYFGGQVYLIPAK